MTRRGFIAGIGAFALYPSFAESAPNMEQKNKIDELQNFISSLGLPTHYFKDTHFRIYENVVKNSAKTEAQRAKERSPEEQARYDEIRKNNMAWKKTNAPAFVDKNEGLLLEAEERFGVSRFYIASILGTESNFGSNTDKYLAINALSSLYFSSRTRSVNLAKSELPELIRFSEAHKPIISWEDNGKKKSYSGVFVPSSRSGAVGYAQFMPSNLNSNLFIPAGASKKKNPFSIDDCIVSIGNYLSRHGWDLAGNAEAPTHGSRNWNAIHSYNKWDEYVLDVIDLAESIKEKYA